MRWAAYTEHFVVDGKALRKRVFALRVLGRYLVLTWTVAQVPMFSRRYPHSPEPRPAPMFREAGQLWLDGRRLAATTGKPYRTLDTFEVVEYAGRLYEVWGRRSDGCYWVGLLSSRGIGREFRASA